MKNIKITTTKKDFTKLYLRLWNGILGLTDGELETLEVIINKYQSILDSGVKEPYCSPLTFSTQSRKEFQSTLNHSQQQFNNYFKQLRDKGILTPKEGYYVIDPRVIPLSLITFQFNIQ